MEVSFLADHPQESKKIAQWYYDEWADEGSNFSFDAIHDNVLEKSSSKNRLPLAFVLHENNQLVGVAELKFRENKHHPEYEHWVGGVLICPFNRNKGYSKILISSAKQHALNLGIKSLYLQCDAIHIDLYKKNGFEVLHESEHFGDVTTVMVCQVGM